MIAVTIYMLIQIGDNVMNLLAFADELVLLATDKPALQAY